MKPGHPMLPKQLLSFLIPATDSFLSGGNIYNQQLINALQEHGLSVWIGQDLARIPATTTHLFVDTLFLEDLPAFLFQKYNCFSADASLRKPISSVWLAGRSLF